ncbi:hypothetical protein ACHAW6_015471 [Cyclotella cf. meneghiniana]
MIQSLETEFETYQGVQNFLCKAIVKVIGKEWLAEIKSEAMGFNHKTPKELLNYLRKVGGDLDHVDVTEIIQALQKPWIILRHMQLCLHEETK